MRKHNETPHISSVLELNTEFALELLWSVRSLKSPGNHGKEAFFLDICPWVIMA